MEGTYNKCPEEYVSFCIMREMGWTLEEYDNQPEEDLKLIKLFMNIEGKVKRGTRS